MADFLLGSTSKFSSLSNDKPLNITKKKSKENANKSLSKEALNIEIEEEVKKDYRFPLDFVDYMERKFIPKKFIPELNQIFQITNTQLNALKYDVLAFQKKNKLNNQLFKPNEYIITAIKGQGDYIYAGNNLGIVRKYSWTSETQCAEFKDQSIFNSSGAKVVMCLDITKDGSCLAVGYSNGFISLWSIKDNIAKLIKVIDKVHRVGVLVLKILTITSLAYELISSDREGNIVLITVTEKFFIKTHQYTVLYHGRAPSFVTDMYDPTDTQKTLYPSCNTDKSIIAFGCIEQVAIFLLKPTVKLLLAVNNPLKNGAKEIPDISFGVGCEPLKNKNRNRSDQNVITPLLAISWNTDMFIYKITLDTPEIQAKPIGYFKNENYQILRIGFIDTSEIYILDSLKKIKVLHTSLMSTQEIVESKKEKSSNANEASPLIDDGQTIDADTLSQRVVFDAEDSKKQLRETYNHYLVTANKRIYFLCKKSFYQGNVLNWEESIRSAKDKGLWEDSLFLALRIFDGSITSLPNIPKDDAKRKKELTKIIQDLLLSYAKHILHKIRGESSCLEILSKCINICIEICIQINIIDFLFTTIQQEFYKFNEDFICLLEPFILLSRFKQFNLSKEIINSLIMFYCDKSQYLLLIQLLSNLKFESIDIQSVHDCCTKYNLFTLIINIESRRHNYYNAIEKIYLKVPKLKEISNFISYSYSLRTMQINDLLISKQYMTHKFLWYCSYCLSRKIFPDDSEIEPTEYEFLVIKIINKLLSNDVFMYFIDFDSYSYFQILTKLFIEDNLIDIINNTPLGKFEIQLNNCDIMRKITKEEADSQTNVEKLFNYITRTSLENLSFLLNQDLNEFIAIYSTKKRLDQSKAIQAGTIIYSFAYETTKQFSKDKYDTFNCHGLITENTFYIKELTDILLFIVDYLDEKQLQEYIVISETSPLTLVKLKLLHKQGNYLRCFSELLKHKDNHQLGKKKVFEWIHKNLQESFENNNPNHDKFISAVLDQLEYLAQYSIDDVMKIADTWFANDQVTIIHKLDQNKKVQFDYVEKILKTKIESDIIKEGDEKIIEYTELLLLHIKLLIELGNKDQILKNLKSRNSYPLDEVLTLCIDNQVNDAAIYIHLATGNTLDAIKIGVESLKKSFENLKEYAVIEANDNQLNWDNLLQQFSNEKENCIHICSSSSETISQKENEELWFLLFNEFYVFLKQINHFKTNNLLEQMKILLSKDIESLLKEMCNYINIKKIIENVTTKFQDAEFKQFKEVLIKMLAMFEHLTDMLSSAKNLLSNSVFYNLKQYKKENSKGTKFNVQKCDYCDGNFYGGEEIIGFKCSHKVHNLPYCLLKDNEFDSCKICRKNEIEDNKTKKKTEDDYDPPKQFDNEQKEMSGQQKQAARWLKMLRAFDNKIYEETDVINGKTVFY